MKFKYWDEVFAGALALVCIFVAAFAGFSEESAAQLIRQPFGAIGEWIGKSVRGDNAAGGWALYVGLGSSIVSNAVQLALSKWLFTVTYTVAFSLITLLVVCLVVIAAEVMKRAIAAHEENQLTV